MESSQKYNETFSDKEKQINGEIARQNNNKQTNKNSLTFENHLEFFPFDFRLPHS